MVIQMRQMYKTIRYSVEKKVAKIVINNPKANALTPHVVRELRHALMLAEESPNVRVRYLTGEGGFFCAGLDLKSLDLDNMTPIEKMIKHQLNPMMLDLIDSGHKIVVCAVNGPAAGAGASIAIGASLTYMAASATLSFPFAKLGLTPDSLSSYLLPRLVGHKKALEILAFGEQMSALEAKELGLVNKVYPSAELQERTFEKALELAAQEDHAILPTTRRLITSNETAEKSAESECHDQRWRLCHGIFASAVLRFREEKNDS